LLPKSFISCSVLLVPFALKMRKGEVKVEGVGGGTFHVSNQEGSSLLLRRTAAYFEE
jgi:hypothetical protein